MPRDADVIIIGAGAAGLSAAIELGRAGLAVAALEARDRIGGRIFTLRDPMFEAPIELGAEFIHGRPPEILNLLKKHKVKIQEADGDNWCVQNDRLVKCDFFSEVDRILEQMDDRKPDQSFLDFLDEYRRKAKRSARQQEAIDRALGYVTGFNAADPSLVSVRWLIKGMRAEERIEGDRAFRAEHGYQDLITIFDRQMREAGVRVQTSTVVESIRWRPGHVEVQAHGPKGIVSISSPGVLITVVLMKMAQ